MKTVPKAQFKPKAFAYFRMVEETGEDLIITDHGKAGMRISRTVDEHDRVLRHNKRLLSGATDLSLEEVVQTIHDADGTAIAAHIDRPSFSILSQLGFIPKDLELDGVEMCADTAPALPQGLAVLSSSDAHRLEEIGARRTRLVVAQPTYAEMRMALKSTGGRRVAT